MTSTSFGEYRLISPFDLSSLLLRKASLQVDLELEKQVSDQIGEFYLEHWNRDNKARR